MVSAGHCFVVGNTIKGGTGIIWGTVNSRAPFPTADMLTISGSYAGSIYGGNQTGTQLVVTGAGAAGVGGLYCNSGYTTYETCNHKVVSTNATFCDPSGCTPGLYSYQGGVLPGPGDSGAPFYYKAGSTVGIRGMIIAIDGNTVFAEKWSTISAQFGVTIVTG